MSYYHLKDGTTGSTVVFINGLFGSFESVPALINSLSDYRQLHVDLYGYVANQSKELFDFDTCVDEIGRLIEDIHSPTTVLIGSGIGGLIAKKITLQRPDLVDAEILIGISGKPLVKPLAESFLKMIDFLNDNMRDKATIRQIAQMFLGSYTDEAEKNNYKGFVSDVFSLSRLRSLLIGGYHEQHFDEQELSKQKIPNLLIANKHDSIIHINDVERFAGRIGTNRGMAVLENAHNHVEGMYDEKLVSYITSFLNSVINTRNHTTQLVESIKRNWFEHINFVPNQLTQPMITEQVTQIQLEGL